MSRGISHKIRKSHVRQNDFNDCGVACLKAILKYHGSDHSLENLRILCGTNKKGTSLSGLHSAAQTLGLESKGLKSNTHHLKSFENPCILHVLKSGKLLHYIVCYGLSEKQNSFIIGDPGNTLPELMSEESLKGIWQQGFLLSLKPTKHLELRKNTYQKQWLWFKLLVKPDENILGISAILGLFIVTLGLAMPIFTQKLVDNILPENDATRLYGGISLLVFLLIVRMGFNYIRSLFLLRQTKAFNLRIVKVFFSHILQLPIVFFDSRKTGDLIARLYDSNRIQKTIALLVNSMLIDLLLILVSTFVIMLYKWELGLLTLVLIPVYFSVAYYFHFPISKGQRKVMEAFSLNESNFIDTIQGIEVIKSSNRQDYYAQTTQHYYKTFQDEAFKLGKLGIKYGLLLEGVGVIVLLTFLTISSLYVLNGELSLGSIFALLQMVTLLAGAIRRLTTYNIQLQEARIAFDRMFELIKIPSERTTDFDNQSGTFIANKLEVKNLSFSYPFGPSVLSGIDFFVTKGEMIAIMGESGGGKSTIAKILLRFYSAKEEHILMDGQPSKSFSIDNWRNEIGVIPQEIKIFNDTLFNNILLGNQSISFDVFYRQMESWGFNQFFEQLPNGYFAIIGEEGVNLSGGQQQLLGLARIMIQDPQWLILDEPTAALDRDTEEFVVALLKEFSENKGIIILTHKAKMATIVNRVYILKNGKVSLTGKPQDLLQTDNLFSRAVNDLSHS